MRLLKRTRINTTRNDTSISLANIMLRMNRRMPTVNLGIADATEWPRSTNALTSDSCMEVSFRVTILDHNFPKLPEHYERHHRCEKGKLSENHAALNSSSGSRYEIYEKFLRMPS
jgi:hypothetical protein